MGRFAFVFFGALIASSLSAVEPTNQWYLRGPEGGFANRLSIDSSGQLTAGGIAGMFRYDTDTSTWSYASAGMPTPIVFDIAETTGATFVNSGGYLARTTNGGDTWTNLSGGLVVGGQLSSIATTPAAPSRVFAAGNPLGILRSDNLGATWTTVIPSGAQVELMRVSPTDANLWFVGPSADAADNPGAGQLFRTPDGGTNFASIASGGSQNFPMQFIDVAQDPFNANRIVALAAPTWLTDKSQGGEVWVSQDAGASWGSGANINNFQLAPDPAPGGEPRAVLFDKFTQNTVYFATTWGVWKSSGGNAAVLSSAGMLQMGPRSPSLVQPYDEVKQLVQANDANHTLYAATSSGGIYKSTNGAASWTAINDGYTGLTVRMFAFQPNSSTVLAGSADPSNTGGVYRSTDFGTSWTRSSAGMNAAAIRGLAFSPTSPNIVLAGGFKQSRVGGENSKGLWRSTDGGQVWTKLTDPGLYSNPVRIVVFDPGDGNRVLAASELRVNISADAGQTWINSEDSPGSFGGLPFANNPDLILLGLAAGPKSGGGTRFYATFFNNLSAGSPLPTACQNAPSLPCKGGVYFSDDGGFNWTRGTGVSGDSASYLSVGATAGTVYVSQTIAGGYPGGVYKSTDYGATWADSSTGLPCRYNFTVAADPSDPQVAWTGCAYTDVAHPGGIFRSNDAGASWVPYGRGLRIPAISWLTVDPAAAGHVLAGGAEGIHEMYFAPDADQDGIPDSEEGAFGDVPGDANGDGTQDATQADVASTGTPAGPLAPARVSATTVGGDYVVVEIDQLAAHSGSCARVSDLALIPSDQVPLSNRMQQTAPTIRFILPDCQMATVKIRYSAVTGYINGVLGSYSPRVPGDATTLAWGAFDQSKVSLDDGGLWIVQLDQNSYGNVYAPDTGTILFQGAPGNDTLFGNGFELP